MNCDSVHECVLLFNKDEVLVNCQSEFIQFPSRQDIQLSDIETAALVDIGVLEGVSYYSGRLAGQVVYPGYSLIKVRQLSQYITGGPLNMAFRAFHILQWLKTNQFCGCCAGKMQMLPLQQEVSVQCEHCGNTVYPRISPAIIVAVFKENEILLARNERFPPGRYSVIAGFVEPGETIEDCVRRELQEEVGISVDHIEYFGNQPWPFPDSLMIAFTACYVSGEITIDDREIVEADWFTADALPDIPDKGTISRQMIDWFIANRRS